jgi:hypothetical protein
MAISTRLAVLVMAASALAAGCASTETRRLSASPEVPAAEGTVRFGKTKNENVSISLVVKHLANPEKLTPPASQYVVWIQPNKSAAPQSLGALKVDKNLEAALDTETAIHSFDLFITAEGSAQALEPAGKPLLWTSYSH